MTTDAIVVLITAPSQETARELAMILLQRKLAACVNITGPIRSLYTWQGEIQDDQEVLMIVKTRRELFDPWLVEAVKAAHPYDTPEIIALPVLTGDENYLKWMVDVTQ